MLRINDNLSFYVAGKNAISEEMLEKSQQYNVGNRIRISNDLSHSNLQKMQHNEIQITAC